MKAHIGREVNSNAIAVYRFCYEESIDYAQIFYARRIKLSLVITGYDSDAYREDIIHSSMAIVLLQQALC